MYCKITNQADLHAAVDELNKLLSQANLSEEKIFDCRLIVYELVGNVFKHTKDDSGLKVVLEGEFIQIKVYSVTPFQLPDVITCSDELCEHGRGLFLVQRLCEEILAEQDGICVKVKRTV
jgi:anti-sigma regulatory factor (Ser/Thr protein kinase)